LWEYIYQKVWQISTLSTFDLVCIKANFNYIAYDQFRCEQKIEEYAVRSTYEKAKVLVESANGCGVIHDKVKWEVDGVGYKSCFCTYKHPEFNRYLFLYNNYSKGIMPFEGPVTRQPAFIIDVFTILDNLKHEKEDDDRKKEEKENKRRNNK